MKLSIRLTRAEAEQLAAGARRAGLSRGAFLAGLLAERPIAGGRLGEPPRLPGRAQRIVRRALDVEPEHPPPDDAAAPGRGAGGAGVPPDARHAGRRRARAPDAWPRARWPSCGLLASPQPRRAAATATRDLKEIDHVPTPDIDGVLIQWGDRLFYPGNRIVKGKPQPKLSALAARQRAAAIRERIEATVVRRAPQVMVKVTGGGRGMKAIAAHFRYISKNGRLEIEDERGETMRGKDALRELADDWRFGGSLIEDTSDRREAFNIMLSMPRGTDPLSVQWAAREFAQSRAGRPQVRDGAARPPGQSACAHQRAGRVQARQAPEPAQDRPASLARDLRREAARAGHRGRGDAAGDARRDAGTIPTYGR